MKITAMMRLGLVLFVVWFGVVWVVVQSAEPKSRPVFAVDKPEPERTWAWVLVPEFVRFIPVPPPASGLLPGIRPPRGDSEDASPDFIPAAPPRGSTSPDVIPSPAPVRPPTPRSSSPDIIPIGAGKNEYWMRAHPNWLGVAPVAVSPPLVLLGLVAIARRHWSQVTASRMTVPIAFAFCIGLIGAGWAVNNYTEQRDQSVESAWETGYRGEYRESVVASRTLRIVAGALTTAGMAGAAMVWWICRSPRRESHLPNPPPLPRQRPLDR